MKARLLASLGSLLASAGMAYAQAPYLMPVWSMPPYPYQPGYGASVMRPAAANAIAQYPQAAPMAFVPTGAVQVQAVGQPMPFTFVQAPPAQPEQVPPPAGVAPAPAVQPQTVPTLPYLPDPGPNAFSDPVGRGNAPRFWASSEYLMWWLKSMPEPVPLAIAALTAPVVVAPIPFNLGDPDTVVALGGQDINSHIRSGGRLSVGYWLDDNQTVGVEGSVLFIAGKSVQKAFSSDGSFFTGAPFINAVTGTPANVLFAAPAGTNPFTAHHVLTATNHLYSAEVNGAFSVGGSDGSRLTALVGGRWVRMNERLNYQVASPHRNGLLDTATFFIQDDFATRNDFYGGQLGLRAAYELGRFAVTFTGKVALGVMNESLQINGASTTGTAPTTGLVVGGVYAQRSNIGTFSQHKFAVVPEGSLNFGYRITEALRATLGYTFLYESSVLRAGDQIDPVINMSQSNIGNVNFGGGGTGTLVGPARPTPLLKTSDFWAHGVSFGLEFRY